MKTELRTELNAPDRRYYEELYYKLEILPTGSNIVKVGDTNLDLDSVSRFMARQNKFNVCSYNSGFVDFSKDIKKEQLKPVRDIGFLYINSPLATITIDMRQWLPRVKDAGFAVIDNFQEVQDLVIEYIHYRNEGIPNPEWRLAKNINNKLAIYRKL